MHAMQIFQHGRFVANFFFVSTKYYFARVYDRSMNLYMNTNCCVLKVKSMSANLVSTRLYIYAYTRG